MLPSTFNKATGLCTQAFVFYFCIFSYKLDLYDATWSIILYCKASIVFKGYYSQKTEWLDEIIVLPVYAYPVSLESNIRSHRRCISRPAPSGDVSSGV
jgi:hypothetical protein